MKRFLFLWLCLITATHHASQFTTASCSSANPECHFIVVDPSVPRHDFYESANLPPSHLGGGWIWVTARLLVFVCFVMTDDLRIVFYHWLYDFDFYVCELLFLARGYSETAHRL